MPTRKLKLPKIKNKIRLDDLHIDATPTGYALRILKAFLWRCQEKWEIHGMSKRERVFYDAMNEHQEDRAKDLIRAITVLERSGAYNGL